MVIIYTKLFDETLEYAISELSTYVSRMSDYKIVPTVKHASVMPKENITGAIRLGLLSEFGLGSDNEVDDIIDIDINGLTGYIAGSNIRSILLGIYRFLNSAGAKWVRPGADGEYIPYCDFASHSFKYRHTASYRFRGECIEGAISFENVRDHIIWLPRVGCNMFFMEQVIPYNYISRWYNRTYNPKKEGDFRTFEEVGEYTKTLELLIKKCGLQLHALGHGFMLEPYGIHYKTWADQYDLSEYGKSHTALVNGERGLFHGSPNFTQLCFSNDEARKGMVNFLVEYLIKKPYIDYLHVWLADANNNHCECENCKKMIPTDFYVQVLNELDEELTKRGMDNRIVFILYNDTIFPPEKLKIINQDRFILLTAFSRNHSYPMSKEDYTGELPKYQRNKFNIPKNFAVNYKFLNMWRENFKGDAFIYEYYFYTDHFADPGYTSLGKVILEDVKVLDELGFQGIVSDQTQRSFFPNGLPLSILSEALFDKDMDIDAYSDEYYRAAYGKDWQKAKAFLEKLSELFDPKTLRTNISIVEEDTGITKRVTTHLWRNNPEAAARFAQIPALAEEFKAVAEENEVQLTNACHKKSWKYLALHTGYVSQLALAYKAGAEGDMEKAQELYNKLFDNLCEDEDEWQPDLDLCLFKQYVGAKFR